SRTIGREHMVLPAAAATTQADIAPASADSDKGTGDSASPTESLLPSADSQGSPDAPSPLEPLTGS
ncbi:MAG: hypothetical protein K0S79_1453, partial [Nitrospira sp.]|nr:hypothetical protein [Nitrospira sp.]